MIFFLHGNGFPPQAYQTFLNTLKASGDVFAMSQKPFSKTKIDPNSIFGWDIFKNEDYILPKDANTFLINKSVARLEQSQAESKQKLVNEVDIQKKVIEFGGPFWSSVLEFSSQNNLLTQRDWSLLSTATAIPSKLPSSDKDFRQLLQLLERARKRGFRK